MQMNKNARHAIRNFIKMKIMMIKTQIKLTKN
jgi:hypothetical protein